MAGKRDAVWVADTIKTHLQTNLPAKLDVLDAEYADGIVLQDVDNSNYYISEVRKLTGFPMITIIPERTDAPSDGQYRYGIEYHFLKIATVVVQTATKEDELTRRSGRYTRAVEEVLLDDTNLNCSVTDVVIEQKIYGPLLTQKNALLKESHVRVRVQTND